LHRAGGSQIHGHAQVQLAPRPWGGIGTLTEDILI
jgi:hypothetical protein